MPNSSTEEARKMCAIFPCDAALREFNFLIKQHGFDLTEVESYGREVSILFRREQIGVRIVYEWAVLPTFFIESYETNQSNKIRSEFEINDKFMRTHGRDMPNGRYSVHRRIEKAFFIRGIYLHIRHADKIKEEVEERIQEVALFMDEHFDEVLRLVL
jgi:hypothetical protein